MSRRTKIWLAVTVLFILVNWFGAGYAAAKGEPLHTAIHAALMFLGAHIAGRLAARRVANY